MALRTTPMLEWSQVGGEFYRDGRKMARGVSNRLAPSEWERVTGLLEPFCDPEPDAEGVRFQYLHDYRGIEVIYSTCRQW